MKTCTKCHTEKPLDAYYRDAGKADGRFSHCKTCTAKRQAEYRSRPENKRRHTDRRYSDKYGLTVTQVEELYVSQSGRCLVCLRGLEPLGVNGSDPLAPVVDHCHAGGHVRGILCSSCNKSLGLWNDDPETFRRAAEYVETHAALEPLEESLEQDEEPAPATERECTMCRRVKGLDEYHKDSHSPGGLRLWCRSCNAASGRVGRQNRRFGTTPPTGPKLPPGVKRCFTCDTWKSTGDFARSKGKRDGLNSQCRSCHSADRRARYYRLSVEAYEAMRQAQSDRCAICEEVMLYEVASTDSLAACVDHCHVTERVRGLLHSVCNRTLGVLGGGDNPESLRRAARYLEEGAEALLPDVARLDADNPTRD